MDTFWQTIEDSSLQQASQHARLERLAYKRPVRSRNEIKKTDPLCNACGLPIGIYGHCGCS